MKNLNKKFIAPLSVLTLTSSLLLSGMTHAAHPQHHHGVNAPIGVMGDHLMEEGDWMMSYRYMNMDMEGNRTGTDRVSPPLAGFMVSPLSMDMNMHMLGGMYGINSDTTIMVMLPYLDSSMDHVINMGPMMGNLFTTDSSGFGDIKISANFNHKGTNTIINVGLSLPTGSIDEKDEIPAMPGVDVQLPYPMQLGSGTYDLLLGATKTGHINKKVNWGAQIKANLRTGTNDNSYTLGNEYAITGWVGHSFTETLAGSFRLNAKNWGNIDGADPALIPGPTVPTKNTDLRGGTRIDAIFGLDTTIGHNNVIGLELGFPIFQDLDGPQLETDATITLGWQTYY